MTDPGLGWWTRAIEDFGTNMGFEDTSNWNVDTLNLSVDGGRYLIDVERSGDEILLAVFRRAPFPAIDEKVSVLLHQCSFERYHPFFLQAGLKGEDLLVLAARLDRFEAHLLYDAFELIRKLYAVARL